MLLYAATRCNLDPWEVSCKQLSRVFDACVWDVCERLLFAWDGLNRHCNIVDKLRSSLLHALCAATKFWVKHADLLFLPYIYVQIWVSRGVCACGPACDTPYQYFKITLAWESLFIQILRTQLFMPLENLSINCCAPELPSLMLLTSSKEHSCVDCMCSSWFGW